ncbi:nitrate- and nitrite sensing domain-containing protein [Sphaerisporangium flaviroseum]|uniref:histidine kinase n=1 Tax=Sphaerisporangium flaviroseum TaxID=509199 RepID=A0ABP7IMT1_9ACTN
MRFHNSRVRAKVTALLLSLVALWSFAAWVTLREGLNLLWVSTLDSSVSHPAERLITELQRERRLTLVLMGDPTSGEQHRGALTAQRRETLKAGAAFHRVIDDSGVRRAASDLVMRRIADADRSLQRLVALRKKIDAGQGDRYATGDTFTQVVESVYHIYDGLAGLDDQEFARDTRTLVAMARAKELLAQEDAFVAGALATGGLSTTDGVKFTQIVGAQRLSLARAAAELPPYELTAYEQLTQSESFKRLRGLEDQLIQGTWANGRSFVDPSRWQTSAGTVISQLDRLIQTSGDALVDRATPLAAGVIIRLILAGGLGLLAVIASIVLSITTARALVRRLEELRAAALELAGRRLPGVVERLGRGDDVDVAAEAPPLAAGGDAIGQVGQAFNTVQETAIRVAVQQAELRRSYRAILLSLARRTQSLVHRQLTILDAMERRETEPAKLAELFRVDHLATRMRRNAENLIVLSGASPGRAWRRSVPMVDVVRGALAEVEDYTQVTLMPMGEAELAGRAIGDVIHLLAELIENAVSFSPPYASVQVSGQEVAKGYVVEIEDRGLGMNREDLAAANARIADPPEFKLTGTPRLGLYVVSRLASRHQIQVTLKASPYGGTTVIVLIPRELINGDLDTETGPVSGPQALPGGPPSPDMTKNGQGGHHPAADVPVQAGRTEDAHPSLLTAPPRWDGDEGDPAGTPLPSRAAPASEPRFSDPPASGPRFSDPPASGPRFSDPPASGPRFSDPPASGPRFPGPPGSEPPSRNETAFVPPPSEPSPAGPPAYTPSGLPRRVAQAHLAPELRVDPPAVLGATPADDDDRSPEELRRLLESFQNGTRRGRSEAARLPHRLDPDSFPHDDEPPMR